MHEGIRKEDIEHLALLARIELEDEEAAALAGDISGILGYVSEIQELTAHSSVQKAVGPLHTVLREDGEPHEGGLYTEDILKEAPLRDGNYIQVKKILGDEG